MAIIKPKCDTCTKAMYRLYTRENYGMFKALPDVFYCHRCGTIKRVTVLVKQ